MRATVRATVLFPEPTGPSMAMMSLLMKIADALAARLRASHALEGALDFPQRIAQQDRPAVRAAHGQIGLRELSEQPFHLGHVERRIHFDCGVAGGAGGDL